MKTQVCGAGIKDLTAGITLAITGGAGRGQTGGRKTGAEAASILARGGELGQGGEDEEA